MVWSASTQYKLHIRSTTLPVSTLLAILQEAKVLEAERQRLEVLHEELQHAYSYYFDGLNTNWDEVLAALEWTHKVLAWFGTNPLPAEFLHLATECGAQTDDLREQHQQLVELRQQVQHEVEFVRTVFPELQIEGRPLSHASFSDVEAWLHVRLQRIADLEAWLALERLRESASQLKLGVLWRELVRVRPEISTLKNAFYRRFWTLWLDEVFHEVPVLRNFAGPSHDLAVERFRALDESLLHSSQLRLREILWKEKPSSGLGIARGGEIATLQREAVKKSRHKALRQLFGEIPNLLLALKPCILMSPLSVAQFLQPDKIAFDVVIFDEASQICSEDAVGAIMRGKQIIVVGDRKQLPPTRFFAGASALESDDDEEEGGEVYESILDECTTIGLPDKMLLWHYRSRNEELIAFSNRHFYESNLVTFPGPFASGSSGAPRGVEFERVNGTYLRGKVKDSRTNPVEAQRVAELVIEHFDTTPQYSLGVIAFNESQATAIDLAVRQMLNTRPDLEKYFVEGIEDAFFVKNLENVQGDERDVIFFSIGYGRDQNGKLSMNFGPLNRAGGERRLNVAVTRARLRVKIVTSLDPTDIDPSRTSATGPKLLRSYLEFAKNATALASRNDTIGNRHLEDAIAKALEDKGWRVHRRVGFSELRIDLAVEDPAQPGRFLLGIECDGSTYITAQTARDRDRLRHQVLSGLGWKLLRVWSPDWIKNPEAQLNRILEQLQQAQNTAIVPTVPAQKTQTPRQAVHTTVALNPISTSTADAFATQQLQAPLKSASFSSATTIPKGAVYYKEFTLRRRGNAEDFYALAEYQPAVLMDALRQVVENEGPIHVQVATRRMIAAWDMTRAGTRLQDIVEDIARKAHSHKIIKRRGKFLWPINLDAPPVRVPKSGAPPRPTDEICLEEIAEAAFLCIRDCFGLEREELITQTARILGYKQTGINVRRRIEEALKLLHKDSRIKIANGSFSLADKG
jgi:very-short-patch-repair endonuclease